MSVLAKNLLIRLSAATLPTKSSTTARMASMPPSRSYRLFCMVWAEAALTASTAATSAAETMRMGFSLGASVGVQSLAGAMTLSAAELRERPDAGFRIAGRDYEARAFRTRGTCVGDVDSAHQRIRLSFMT